LMPPGLFGSTTIDCSACMEKANTRGTTGATSVVVALESVSEMAANITAGQLRRRMSQSCAITAFASQRRWLQSGSWTGRSGLATSAVAYRAGRSSRRHSGGSVLSWLAGFVAKSRESRRAEINQ
jgi:hypothetical protein